MAGFPIVRAAYFSTPGDLRGLVSGKGDILVGTTGGGLQRIAAGATGETVIFNPLTDSGVEVTDSPHFAGKTMADGGFESGALSFGVTSNTIEAGSSLTITASGGMGYVTLNTAPPLNDNHAVTKSYVDSMSQTLNLKKTVKFKTATTLPAYTVSEDGLTLTGNSTGTLNVDGFNMSSGDRILVDQLGTGTGAPSASCGIYTVTNNGRFGGYVLTRSSDADTSDKVKSGLFTFVSQGNTYADKGFILTTNDPITLGTTQLSFSQFTQQGASGDSGQIQYNNGGVFGASSGLSFASGVLSVDAIAAAAAGRVSILGATGSDAGNAVLVGVMTGQENIGDSLALGLGSSAAEKSCAIGNGATAAGLSAMAFGTSSTASDENTISCGTGSGATGVSAISLGASAVSFGDYALGIGPGCSAQAIDAVGIGHNAESTGEKSLSVGTSAAASAYAGAAIGLEARAALTGCCNISAYHILRKDGASFSYGRSVAQSMIAIDSFTLSSPVPYEAGTIVLPTGSMFFPVGVRMWCSKFTSVHASESAFTVTIGVGSSSLGDDIATTTSVVPTAVGSSQLQIPISYQSGLTGTIYITNLVRFPLSVFQYRLGIYGHLVEME